MSQETEKEDPRQVPPKQYGGTQPGHAVGTGSKPGGMRDDLDESRGATDGEGDDDFSRERSGKSRSSAGSQSGKDSPQQQGGEKTRKEDKGGSDRTSAGSSSGSGDSASGGSTAKRR